MNYYLGADLKTIAEARAKAFVIEQYFRVKPDLDIQDKFVRIYFPPDKLQRAQENFKGEMQKPPGKVRDEMSQVFIPWAVEKFALPLFGLFALGLLIGKQMK